MTDPVDQRIVDTLLLNCRFLPRLRCKRKGYLGIPLPLRTTLDNAFTDKDDSLGSWWLWSNK